jgi:hypothetical protein
LGALLALRIGVRDQKDFDHLFDALRKAGFED